jgi:hypothetical protein
MLYSKEKIRRAKRLAYEAELMQVCNTVFEKLTEEPFYFNDQSLQSALTYFVDNILTESRYLQKIPFGLMALKYTTSGGELTAAEKKQFDAIIKPVLDVWVKIEKITV